MGTLYLVRHGQASFGAADYDQLSPLGQRQSQRLGEHFRSHGLRFATVLTGTLRRQTQTWQGIADGMGVSTPSLPWPGLNEYDPAALIAALGAPTPAPATTPEGYRQHFRLLRMALERWMAGTIAPAGMPTHAAFVAGVTSALAHVQNGGGGDVLLVSSGGPIAMAVAHLLGASAPAAIDLNLRLRNTAVCEVAYSPRRCTLLSFNALPHLSSPELADWITYA
jgi:broad specificity phosphatase PhoE